MNESTTTEVSIVLDLQQFVASLAKIPGISQETVNQVQKIFGTVKSLEVPIDPSKIHQVGVQFNNVGQSAQSLNNIVSDVPLAFQNLDMGIVAVSNHINPLINDLLRAKTPTVSWKSAIGDVTSGLVGVGGLSIAFTLITIAIKAVSSIMSEGAEETEKMKDAVKGLRNELERASYQTLKQKEIEARIKLMDAENKLIKEQYELKIKGEAAQKNYRPLDQSTLGTKETKEEVNLARERLKVITEYQDKLGLVSQQENRIAELREKRKGLRSEVAIKDIDAEIKALEKLYDYDKKTKKAAKDKTPEEIKFRREHLGLTNEMIRAEIKLIDVKLADPDFRGDRVQNIKNRIELQKLLTKGTKEYIETLSLQKLKSLKGPFEIKPVEKVPKPDVIGRSNIELERSLFLSDMLTDSFNQAGNAIASAMAASLVPFKTANSLLQIFINELIQAAAQALILKAITAGFGFIGGLLGFSNGGLFTGNSSGFANGGLFRGSSGVDRNLVRLSDGEFIVNSNSTQRFLPLLSAINYAPKYAGGGYHGASGSNSPIIQTIILDSIIKGKDIRLTQRKEASYRRKYYGSPNG